MAHQRLFPFQQIADSQTTTLTPDPPSICYLVFKGDTILQNSPPKIVHAFIFSPPLLSIFPSRNNFLISLRKYLVV